MAGERAADTSGPSRPWRALYRSKTWRALRKDTLIRDGYICRICRAPLIGSFGNPNSPVVDHVIPHKGDYDLFHDPDNLQALCKRCHDSRKQSEERTGYRRDVGDDGWPTDPRHPFNSQYVAGDQ